MKIYIGFNWSKSIRDKNTYPYCFQSIAVCYSYAEGKRLPAWKINNAKEIMLDSGGFSLLNKYGDYPFSTKDYVDWIHRMDEINDGKVKYVAIRDYPCEPDITRKISMLSNVERIKKTVDNTIECMSYDIPGKWMPVLQGYIKQDYLACLQLLKDKDVDIGDCIALGSMCRRTNIREIKDIFCSIQKGYSGKIHLFGLTMNALKDSWLKDNISSCDTIGYTYMCGGNGETLMKFNQLVDRIKNIRMSDTKQIVFEG